MTNVHRTVLSLFVAAGLLVPAAAFADADKTPSSLCGDHGKDVKKPKDDKKQPNPACGDHGKDVKKPKDDKKQPNPA
jgi:hypothetical protein